jgi:hypothetical protein
MIILVKLFLAHIIGDFVIQPNGWVEEKEKKKHASPKLYLHVILHGALVLLLLWDIAYWKQALAIMISHWVIDVFKLHVQDKDNKRLMFFLDQTLHLIAIVVVWYLSIDMTLNFHEIITLPNLLYFTALVFLSNPTSVLIKVIMSKWAPQFESDKKSLKNAGKYIGILERLLSFAFVISGHWEAVGFLLAAKSVFRFGDLKEAKDRKLTEYILIGTLLSFGIAILIALIVNFMVNSSSNVVLQM